MEIVDEIAAEGTHTQIVSLALLRDGGDDRMRGSAARFVQP